MIALLIIDHGSTKKQANDMLHDVAALLKNKRPDLIIEAAHMELAAPSIPEAIQSCISQGATHIIAHPYMLSPGRHATQDIPNLMKKATEPYPTLTYTVTQPLGIHEKLTEVILERAAL